MAEAYALIFFKLPYWSTLLFRHNLDVMHVEKNIFDSVIWTIMNIKHKTWKELIYYFVFILVQGTT